ncbi:MAG: SLATT domain-containing protein [Anaerolineales bacterium]|nr:SLATT domain-containing protein [Anaerolineales bacterium]MCB9145178.1 SLATT domain-containing protein [Anaerolineales bacterium]
METETQEPTPILQIAWTRFAQMDAYSTKRTKIHTLFRRWIAVLSVLATFFAVITTYFPSDQPSLLGVVLKVFLIMTPILASALAAYGSKFLSSGDWLVARAGAEEILKEIYMYRTVLKNSAHRNVWLENRLVEIQRSVFRGLNGELTIPPYEGYLPPHYNQQDAYSDPGFHDLPGDEYFRYRLESQLGWHVRKVNKYQQERVRLQLFIILSGVAGAAFAVFIPLWTALAASFTAVLIGWQELRNLDSVVRNYSKVIMELSILFDHWRNLDRTSQTDAEFFKMVRSTEDILWGQNVEYIKAMQEALKESDLEEEASLINQVIKEARESDRRLKQNMRDAVVDFTADRLEESEEKITENFKEVLSSLAEEASSDLVQAELAEMRKAAQKFSENLANKIGLSSALEEIFAEFKGVDVSVSTPRETLNNLLARYPKNSEVKG